MSATDARNLAAMHEQFGVTPGRVCRDCAHCVHVPRIANGKSAPTRRCAKLDPKRDAHQRPRWPLWRVSWTACGAFQETEA